MSEGKIYDWNEGTIENPNEGGGGYTLLPPGIYPFKITRFERGEYPGSAKIPPCKKAIVYMELDGGPHGKVEVKDDLILYSTLDWKLCEFFKGIGDRKSGDPLKMNWMGITGKTGHCKLINKEMTTGKHAGKTFNEIDGYVDPSTTEDMSWMQPAQSTQAPAPGAWG